MYPSTLGTHQHRSHATLPPAVRCFTEYLREAGYYCSNNDKKDYNFDDAKDAWDVSSRTAHWRGRAADQPFFSVFNYGVSHESLLHKTEADAEAIRKQWGVERHDPAKVRIPAYHPDIPEFREDWARYYDCVSALDAQIAERLKELDADGLSENTIVFFWGDHGTGITRGKRWLYESGTRVPLIIRFPKRFQHLAPGNPGSLESRMVQLMDLGPSVLALAGAPIPESMQAEAFLGDRVKPLRKYLFFIRDRMDEAYDCIRAVRSERFRYIRNFYPHIPYDQHNAYLYKERSMQAWHRLTGKLDGPAALFLRPEKPMEELFDTEAGPDEIHNLAQDPAYADTLRDMRARLNAWIVETRDLGLLDEAEMYRRAEGKPPMQLGRDTAAYDLPRILDTANLPLNGEACAPELLSRLKDADSAVRYWAATGLAVLKPTSVEAAEALRAALEDASPSVRVAAAHALCRIGQYDAALPALAALLKNADRFIRIRTLNVLALQEEKAATVLDALNAARSDADAGVKRAAESAWTRIPEKTAEVHAQV